MIAKEPWQMTREEWRVSQLEKAREELALMKKMSEEQYAAAHRGASRTADIEIHETQYIPSLEAGGEIRYKAWGRVAGKRAQVTYTYNAMTGHRTEVELAIRQGKPVPAEVLAEYPDLGAIPKAEGELQQLLSFLTTAISRESTETKLRQRFGDAVFDWAHRQGFITGTPQPSPSKRVMSITLKGRQQLEEKVIIPKAEAITPEVTKVSMTVTDYDREYLTSDLIRLAKEKGISTSGDKKAIIRRLLEGGYL